MNYSPPPFLGFDDSLRHIPKSLIDSAETDIARLEYHVAQLQSMLSDAMRRLENARNAVPTHKALLSPIRHIPVELLQKIFLHCLPDGEYTRPSPYTAPLLLTQVCSSWRHLALASPRLWTSLWVQVSSTNLDRRLNTMATWFQRSGACPLSLYAQIQPLGLPIVHMFFMLLDLYRTRWKDLRLVFPFSWSGPALEILSRGAPSLEVLRIRIARSSNTSPSTLHTPFIITDDSAPKLRRLSWGITGSERVPVLPQLSHLTELDVDYTLSVLECLQVLQQCPNLESCEFWKIRTIPDPLTLYSLSPLVVPKLRTLALHSTHVVGALLDHLTLPTLSWLKISVIMDDEDHTTWSQSSFNSFLARSSCSLRSLNLHNVLPSEDTLIQCLQGVSASLTELILLDTRGAFLLRDTALSLLTPSQAMDGKVICLCPKLEVIRLGRSLLATDGKLGEMIESRWKHNQCWGQVARLRSISPSIRAADHPEDVHRLTMLREEGLHWS